MKVTTEEMRRAANILIDHLENLGEREIVIDDDFYWNIPETEMYNPYERPVNLDMGQLSDDLEEIRKLIAKKSLCVSYGLVWLSSIFRRVGEMIVR